MIVRYTFKNFKHLCNQEASNNCCWLGNCCDVIVMFCASRLAKWVPAAFKKTPETIVELSFKKFNITNTLGGLDSVIKLW